MKFKAGDRVRCIISNDKPKFRALGTVYSTDTIVHVNWDEDCGGNKIEEFGVMKGHGWCMLEKELELCDDKGDKMEDLKGLLKVGRVVELRNGDKFFVLPDRLIGRDRSIDLQKYTKDLKVSFAGVSTADVIRIFNAPMIDGVCWNFNISTRGLELVWERPVKKVFSKDEITIAECIDKEFKYLIREKDDSFWAYVNKPVRFRDSWETPFGEISNMKAFKHLFQQIRFEDNKPTLISDIIGG